MILDGRQSAVDDQMDADVVIAGAGAAGITVARALAARGVRVVLLESGGIDFDPAVQDLYRGTQSGDGYTALTAGRLRYFGGTTNHWNGWCVPPQQDDFTGSEAHPELAWPIGERDLRPFLAEAFQTLDLGPYPLAADQAPARQTRLPADDFRPCQIHVSPPTRFAEKYRAEIERNALLRLILHASLTTVELDESHAGVTQVAAQTLTGRTITVTGRFFVLACHAVENARILLNNTRQIETGLGNEHDLVGRYFADHPSYQPGRLLLYRGNLTGRDFAQRTWLGGEAEGPVAITPAPAMLARYGAMPFRVHFVSPVTDRQMVGTLDAVGEILRTVHPDTHAELGSNLLDAYAQCMQFPNRESRITLAAESDPLGQRFPHLHYALHEADHRTAQAIPHMLGRYFGAAGIGRFRVAPGMRETPDVSFLSHHIGTTRMSADARTGVTDRDCRVHSLRNLYVAGSSVFANAGNFTPTFMIVVLALRLAAHLGQRLRG